jgi:hypothetical protein
MIAFVTLLLGLVHGVFPVEVRVSTPVVAVDFSLDGMPAGRLEGPPWGSQRIVWVEGRHLPQAVSRTPAAGVELVGAGR